MSLITKKYLSLDDANSYFISKTRNRLGIEDIRQLEREGKITPLVYLDVNFINKTLPNGNLYSFDLPDNKFIKRIKGYFKPSNFVLLDCYEPTQYNFMEEFALKDKVECLHFNDGRELFELIEEVPRNTNTIDGSGYIFNKSKKDESGFYQDINIINIKDILIQRSELDELINSYKHSDKQRIVELQSELAQVKAQLKERTDTPADDNELSTRSQNLAAKIILALIDVAGLDKDSPPYQYDELNSNNRLIYDQIKANNMEVSQQKIGYWLDLASKQATDK